MHLVIIDTKRADLRAVAGLGDGEGNSRRRSG